ncbi:hypothetical protein J437_LFUL002272 [Ladona fulva]|uniref:Protein ABHD18 n=1 Tax=Ladona fulva TaxID=123851 RepID=A0A8K0NU80_LADFU|nr:hypothetical protein J437_LFUL002272 [Ladona fulva]
MNPTSLSKFFWRRRQLMAKPLLKKAGIGSILVENPFYGLRRPKDQVRSNLHNVSDIFVMGGCLMLESLALFHWCEKEGFGPLGITGISMGGHMASLAATNWPKPLVLVPCLSWSTASGVFTKGVMSGAIHWDILMDQYFSNGKYREEIKKMLFCQEDAFRAGQLFAQNFPQSMDLIEQFQSEETSKSTQGTTSLSSNQGGVRNKAYAKQTAEKSRGSINSVLAQGMLKNPSTVQLKRDHSDTVSSKMNPTLVDVTEFSEKVEAEVLKRSNPVHEDESAILSMSVKEQEVHVDVKNGNEKKTTQNLLEILSPSKLMDTKNILAGFHVSKSKLLSLYGESEVDRKAITQEDLAREEALQFMRGIMDECTHLKNFDVPFDPELVIAVSAKDDGYVPQEGVTDLRDIWPGIEVRHLDAGHVSAYVLYQHAFRAAIVDAFERAFKKYNSF